VYNSSKDDDVLEVTGELQLIIIFTSIDIFPEDNNNIFDTSNNFISESLHKKAYVSIDIIFVPLIFPTLP